MEALYGRGLAYRKPGAKQCLPSSSSHKRTLAGFARLQLRSSANRRDEVGGESSGEGKVRVKLVLHNECLFGQKYSVVGEEADLGWWDPRAAIPMTWSQGHKWTAQVEVPVGKRIEFKFILRGKSGEIEWQPGPNRVFETWETSATILVLSNGWETLQLDTFTEDAGPPDEEEAVDAMYSKGYNPQLPVLVPGLAVVFDDAEETEGSCSKHAPSFPRHTLEPSKVISSNFEQGQGSSPTKSCAGSQPHLLHNPSEVFPTPANQTSVQKETATTKGQTSSATELFKNEDPQTSSSTNCNEGEGFNSTIDVGVNSPSGNLLFENEDPRSSFSTNCSEGEGFNLSTDVGVNSPSGNLLFENKDPGTSSSTNCSEGEGINSCTDVGVNSPSGNLVNSQPDTSVLQNDFDWGRKALSKLISSLGIKHQEVDEQDRSK
eukprot:Gb_19508 [translate_table: standard]